MGHTFQLKDLRLPFATKGEPQSPLSPPGGTQYTANGHKLPFCAMVIVPSPFGRVMLIEQGG